ncbi:hypothetical protein BGZ52_011444, partial [Haplosporangium bisporale]
AQMMTGGDEFQQFQLQLQQQNQLLQMQQMQQMQQQQMLQNQMTGFGGQNFQPNMVTAQPTGFNTNPFTMQQQQSQADMFGGSSMNLLGGGMGNGIGNGSMGNMSSVLPQSTGNPFRTNSSIGSMSAPSQPQMTGATHYNTMPSLSSQPTGTNPFAPSANPLNPFSPNFGKVPAQPTGMAGMNNNNNNNNMNMGMGVNGGMMVNNNPTGANNPWGQHQQSAFGHQASGSSFM